MLDAGVRPTPHRGFALEELDGEILLLDPASERLIHCNVTAALVWRLCDGERTLGEIAALLAEAYPDATDAIAGDVASAVETLAAEGALALR
jgi:hypothetical protein